MPALSSRKESTGRKLPIAIIGAGPIGLSAAAQLIARGEVPIILDAGAAAGANIRQWAHVRLFSPWKYLVDPASRRLLEARGWRMPDEEALPTGGELLRDLIEPLAAVPEIAPHLRLGHRVTAVTRQGFDKVKSTGRDDAAFELVIEQPDHRIIRILARAVIDASGTWATPNPIGAGGIPVDGEREFASSIRHAVPDVLGSERARYAGRRTLVLGSGHSAFNAVLDLARLRDAVPTTHVVWAVRRTVPGLMFGGGERDGLEERGALGSRLRRLVDDGAIALEYGVRVARIYGSADNLTIETDDGRALGPVDEVIVATGFRPDLSMARELRLGLDPLLEAPIALAPLIDPNEHSCGTVYPHGAAELAHPERDYYVAGMKSYGRAPTFLLLTGYEQVRSIACALTGDEAGARAVELVLPETGVCQTDLGGASCCTTSEPLVSLGSAKASRCG